MMNSYIDAAWVILKRNGFKGTKARLSLVKLFSELEKPINAYALKDRLAELMGKNVPNVVTIYRTLETFENLGLIHRVTSVNGYFRCDLGHQSVCESKEGDCHHSFLVCRECDYVKEYFDESSCCSSERLVADKAGFKCETHVNEVIGLCANCQ